MRSYKEVREEVDTMADNLGMPIDEHIKKIVIALRMYELATDGSCEGHLDHGLPYPWVDMYAPDQAKQAWIKANAREREKLNKLLADFYGASRRHALFEFEPIGIFGGFRIVPVSRRTLPPTNESLKSQQKDFDDFADFLLSGAVKHDS